METLGPKHPSEIKTIRFNFARDLGAGINIVSSVPVVATVIDGADPSPGSVVLGGVTLASPSVLQRIQGGVDGASYLLECAATDSAGNVHVAQAVLAVSRKLY
jgi:hypothetical protein